MRIQMLPIPYSPPPPRLLPESTYPPTIRPSPFHSTIIALHIKINCNELEEEDAVAATSTVADVRIDAEEAAATATATAAAPCHRPEFATPIRLTVILWCLH